MAVDVSKIPNNNKFDPVREAILALEAEITGGALPTLDSVTDNGAVTTNTITVGGLNSTGDVGIGTSSPNDLLHIYSDSADANLRVETTAAGYDARINLIGSSSGTSQIRFGDEADVNVGLLTYDHSDNSMRFRTADSEHMRLTSAGNVGIGTASPSYSIDVFNASPSLQLYETSSGTSTRFRIEVDSSGTTYTTTFGSGGGKQHIWKGGGSEVMRLDQNGYLGIGTGNPQSNLDIYDSVPTIRLTDSVGAYHTISGTGNGDLTISVDEGSSGSLDSNFIVRIDDTVALNIDSNFNVGIGTTANAAAKLHVKDDDGAEIRIEDNTSTTFEVLRFIGDAGTYEKGLIGYNSANAFDADSLHLFNLAGDVVFRANTGGSSTERMRILAAGGDVGINTSSPERKLHVVDGTTQGVARFQNSSTTSVFIDFKDANTTNDNYVRVGARGDDLSLYAGNGERIRVLSNGDVGIGTSSPTRTLHVNSAGDNVVAHFESTDQLASVRFTDSFAYSDIGHNVGQFQIDVDPSDVGSASKFIVKIDGDEKLTLLNSGNLGLGTTSPDADIHLYRDDNIAFRFESANAGANTIQFGSTAEEAYGRLRYDTGTHDMRFYTNNSEKVRIDTDGNVGIGTTSPAAKLEIAGTGTLFQVTGAANREFYIDTTNPDILKKNQNLAFAADPSDSHLDTDIRFEVDGDQIFNIDASGAYLQTNTGDASLYISHIENNKQAKIVFRENVTTNIKWAIGYDDAQGNDFFFQPLETALGSTGSNTAVLSLSNLGYVGINTNDASHALDVHGSKIRLTATGTPEIELYDEGNAGGGGASSQIVYRNTAGRMLFMGIDNDDNTNSNFVITNNPNNTLGGIDSAAVADDSDIILDPKNFVGISTSNPTAPLSVIGSEGSSVATFTTLDSGGSNRGIRIVPETFGATIGAVGLSTELAFNTSDASGTAERVRIDSDGHVGINETNPSALLHITTNDTSNLAHFLLENTNGGAGTGPNLALYRNSSTPANNDVLGTLHFFGKDSAGTQIRYASLFTEIADVSAGAHDSRFVFYNFIDGVGDYSMVLEGRRLGIGESNPDANVHIKNTGLTSQKFENFGTAYWNLGIPSGQTYFAFDNVNDNLSSPKMTISSAGDLTVTGDVNVGDKLIVGTEATSSYMSGNDAASFEGYIMTTGMINYTETGTGPAGVIFGISGGTLANDYVSLVTGGVVGLQVNPSQVVSVTTRLNSDGDTYLYGDTFTSGDFTFDSAGQNFIINRDASDRVGIAWQASGVNQWYNRHYANGDLSIDRVGGSGGFLFENTNVGIGVSPSYTLDVNGTIQAYDVLRINSIAAGSPYLAFYQSDVQKAYLQYADIGDELKLSSDGTINLLVNETDSAVYIDASAHVGINTTSPAQPLDVTGNARITGNIYLGQYLYHNGDTNTYLRFTGDRVRIFAGGVEMIDCVEGAADYVDIADTVRVDKTNNYFECTGDIIGYTSTTISDAKKKENIKRIDSPIEKIQQINGYTFDWKHNGNASAGVIAQEVEKILPEAVQQREKSMTDDEPYLTVEYNGLIGLLIETVKEQQEQIEDLKAEIKHIKGLF